MSCRCPQANTKYDGFAEGDVTVAYFWEVVHAFDAEDKRALLTFATGCDRAPIGGLGKLSFILQRSGILESKRRASIALRLL